MVLCSRALSLALSLWFHPHWPATLWIRPADIKCSDARTGRLLSFFSLFSFVVMPWVALIGMLFFVPFTSIQFLLCIIQELLLIFLVSVQRIWLLLLGGYMILAFIFTATTSCTTTATGRLG